MITTERLLWNTLVAALVAATTLFAAVVDEDSNEGFFGEVELIAGETDVFLLAGVHTVLGRVGGSVLRVQVRAV